MVYRRKHEYEYREGWHPKVDANTVGGVVEQIEEKNGEVTSELFLDASRPEDSPTHAVFEWDDSAAAEKYRLQQASATIGAIRVVVRVIEDNTARDVPHRAYVNVVDDNSLKGRYINVVDAMSNADTRAAVLRRALRELKVFQDKYSTLSELAAVFAAIKSVGA